MCASRVPATTAKSAAIGEIAAKSGGIDELAFSGGMGKHAPQVRARIFDPFGHPGLVLDAEANQANGTRISAARSKPVLRIAADEEAVMRELVEVALARIKDD